MSTQIAVLMTGAPATGKSTVGRLVARALKAALLDQDVITGPLVEAIGADLDGPSGLALRRARYESIVATAEDCLAVGVSVVLVAPFTTERTDVDAYRQLEARLGVPTTLVWLTAPAAVLVARMTARGALRDAGKLADPDAYFSTGLLAPPAAPHVAVDASVDPVTQLENILTSLP
ncbi:AAA family ATPase [Cryptosporangium phraense]|uniref:ATP-binding protein n=1 Tax=Cryptosporangium phraense TaxID=2593070 RepID=A0A545AIA0_9ACTN|nr:ATP-binding protein [Cryptosporangium phraense]TQS41043.1 ATP-binding protein [Cryptosporangium phraense]